ncbi:hypothetical protein HZA96_00610 [Candidatus Woesearchaeota archaeon]|nr:hypothetical protein [Candidatus Woesearchaeota archaeon]
MMKKGQVYYYLLIVSIVAVVAIVVLFKMNNNNNSNNNTFSDQSTAVISEESDLAGEAISRVKPICKETDVDKPLKEEFVAGEITFTNLKNNGESFQDTKKDYCKDNKFLIEYSCKDYKYKGSSVSISSTVYHAVYCENGCNQQQGVCNVGSDSGQQEQLCIDDDGKNIHNKGSVYGKYYLSESPSSDEEIVFSTQYDTCSKVESGAEFPDGKYVAENECDKNDFIHTYYYKCPETEWCYDGECKPIKCVDPDGNDLTTKTKVTGYNPLSESMTAWGDYCSETKTSGSAKSGKYINEAVCNGINIDYLKPTECPSDQWCYDGACKKKA